jgi:hypothetical protein
MVRASTIALCSFLTTPVYWRLCDAGGLRNSNRSAEVSKDDAESSLTFELAGNVSNARLSEIEAQLRPTILALPKGPGGQIGHEAVRYVLHRLFVQRHSWYLRGLESGAGGSDWIPAHLQGKLEQRFGGDGIHLKEVAALAAALEDLVHKEAAGHLEEVYALHGFSTEGLRTPEEVREAIGTYVVLYLKNMGSYGFQQHTFTFGVRADSLQSDKAKFQESYIQWSEVEDWFQAIANRHIERSGTGGLDFAAVSSLLAEVSESFGFFNDRDCRELKSTLLDMQVGQTGRIRLSDFYGKSLQSHWQFIERVDYLRAGGVLDEMTDPSEPRVLLANYVSSKSNCIESSMLYSVCCRNECEDLIGKLEVEIGAPTAEVRQISDFVRELPSPTVTAPRSLSDLMLRRLDEIASANGGRVPIHGRLFAQWMHHAYPRECPYPQEAGTLNPRAPFEWMKSDVAANASEDTVRAEMLQRWTDREQKLKDAAVDQREVSSSASVDEETAELHWSDVEETFCGLADAPASSSPDSSSEIAPPTRGSLPHFVTHLAASPPFWREAIWCIGVVVICGGGFLTFVAARAEGRGEGLSLPFGTETCGKKPVFTPAQRQGLLLAMGALAVVALVAVADVTGLLDRRSFVSAVGFGGVAVVGSAMVKRFRAGAALAAKTKGCEDYDHLA